MSGLVFANTLYWAALIDPRNGLHSEATEMSVLIAGRPIVTADEVVTELLTLLAGASHLRYRATVAVQAILDDPSIRVLPQTRESFLAGFRLYCNRPDKACSLPDCISMCAMHQKGITDVLTNDRHFEQEGFRALFRQPAGD